MSLFEIVLGRHLAGSLGLVDGEEINEISVGLRRMHPKGHQILTVPSINQKSRCSNPTRRDVFFSLWGVVPNEEDDDE